MFVSSSYAKKYKLNPVAIFEITGIKEEIYVLSNYTENVDPDEIFPEVNVISGNIEFVFPPVDESNIQRTIFYIGGPGGIGKTSLASDLALRYRKAFPKNNIAFLSPKKQPPLLKSLGVLDINITRPDAIHNNFIDPTSRLYVQNDDGTNGAFENSLVIYDDLEPVPDEVGDLIKNQLLDPMLTIGRSQLISVILSKHLILDNKKTRLILLEMDYLVIFPGVNVRQIRRCLETYIGLEKAQIKEILDTKARFVTIHTKAPMFAFTNKRLWRL